MTEQSADNVFGDLVAGSSTCALEFPPQSQGLGDRLRELRGLLDQIAKLGLSLDELGEIGKAFKAILEAQGIEAKIRAASAALSVFAKATANETDDKVASLVKDLVDKHLDWILALFPSAGVAAPVITSADAGALALPWGEIIKIIMFIVELVQKFGGK